jgi:hypothetical protein
MKTSIPETESDYASADVSGQTKEFEKLFCEFACYLNHLHVYNESNSDGKEFFSEIAGVYDGGRFRTRKKALNDSKEH